MNFDAWIPLIGSVLGGGGAVALIGWLKDRQKTKAEADTTISDNAIKLVESLTKRIDKLESDLDSLRKENLGLHREVASLQTELRFLRTTTVPFPTIPQPPPPPLSS